MSNNFNSANRILRATAFVVVITFSVQTCMCLPAEAKLDTSTDAAKATTLRPIRSIEQERPLFPRKIEIPAAGTEQANAVRSVVREVSYTIPSAGRAGGGMKVVLPIVEEALNVERIDKDWIRNRMLEILYYFSVPSGVPENKFEDTWAHTEFVAQTARELANLAKSNGKNVDPELTELFAYGHDIAGVTRGSAYYARAKDTFDPFYHTEVGRVFFEGYAEEFRRQGKKDMAQLMEHLAILSQRHAGLVGNIQEDSRTYLGTDEELLLVDALGTGEDWQDDKFENAKLIAAVSDATCLAQPEKLQVGQEGIIDLSVNGVTILDKVKALGEKTLVFNAIDSRPIVKEDKQFMEGEKISAEWSRLSVRFWQVEGRQRATITIEKLPNGYIRIMRHMDDGRVTIESESAVNRFMSFEVSVEGKAIVITKRVRGSKEATFERYSAYCSPGESKERYRLLFDRMFGRLEELTEQHFATVETETELMQVKDAGVPGAAVRSGQAKTVVIEPTAVDTRIAVSEKALNVDWATEALLDWRASQKAGRPVPFQGHERKRMIERPGFMFSRLLETLDDEGFRPVAAINGNDIGWWPNCLVIANGKLVIKPAGRYALRQSESEFKPMSGDISSVIFASDGTFRFEKVGIQNVSIVNPSRYAETNGLSGQPIVWEGRHQPLESAPENTAPLGDVVDRSKAVAECSWSAVWTDKEAKMLRLFTFHGNLKADDIGRILQEKGAYYAILLGGGGSREIGGDAQLYTEKSGSLNDQTGFYQTDRVLPAAILFFPKGKAPAQEQLARYVAAVDSGGEALEVEGRETVASSATRWPDRVVDIETIVREKARHINAGRSAQDRQRIRELIEQLQATPQGESFTDEQKDAILKVFPELALFKEIEFESRLEHIFRVIQYLQKLTSLDYQYFFDHLPVEDRRALTSNPESKQRYYLNLQRFTNKYRELTDEEKELLWLCVILHDIGYLLRLPVGHAQPGAEFIEPILRQLGFSEDMVNLGAQVVGNHIHLGGVLLGQIPPERFLGITERVSDEQYMQTRFCDFLSILTVMDTCGYLPEVSNLRPFYFDWFVEYDNLEAMRRLARSGDYYQHRLRYLARRVISQPPLDKADCERLNKRISELVPAEEMDFFVNNIGRVLDFTDALTLMFALGSDETFTDFVKFLRFATQVAEISSQDSQMQNIVLIEPNLFLRDIPQQDPEFLARFQSALRSIPDDITIDQVSAHLEANNWSEFYGIPIAVGDEKLVIDIKQMVEDAQTEKTVASSEGRSASQPVQLPSGLEGLKMYAATAGEPIVVAIDGAAGVGCSAIAGQIAQAMNGVYISLGQLYRLVTWIALRNNYSPEDITEPEILSKLLHNIKPITDEDRLDFAYEERVVSSLTGETVQVNTLRLTDELRSREIERNVPLYAARVHRDAVTLAKRLVGQLKNQGRNVVAEGRIATTVVCPDADARIQLTASSRSRAERRAEDLIKRQGLRQAYAGRSTAVAEPMTDEEMHQALIDAIKQEDRERDAKDEEHIPKPHPAIELPPVVVVDATDMTEGAVADKVAQLVVEEHTKRSSGLSPAVSALLQKLILDLSSDEPVSDEIRGQILTIFPELSRVSKERLEHIFRVIEHFHRLTDGNFDYFVERLTEETAQGWDEAELANYREGLSEWFYTYRSLSTKQQQALWLAVLLHDIGCIVQDDMHPEYGGELCLPLLRRVSLSGGLTPIVQRTIRNHIMIGAVVMGEYTPHYLLRVLDEIPQADQAMLLNFITLTNVADCAGYVEGANRFNPYWAERYAKASVLENLAEANRQPATLVTEDPNAVAIMDSPNSLGTAGHFALYRLEKLARRHINEPLTAEERQRLLAKVKELIPEEEMEFFLSHLNSTINTVAATNYGCYLATADPSYENLVKLLRFFAQVAELSRRGVGYDVPLVNMRNNLRSVPPDEREKVLAEFNKALQDVPRHMNITQVQQELNDNNWSVFCDIPIVLENDSLTVDLAFLPHYSGLKERRLSYSAGKYEKHLCWQIEEAACDFTGQPAMEENTTESTRRRARKAQRILRFIVNDPGRYGQFLDFLGNYPGGHTFTNRLFPIYFALYNYLAERPMDDRRVLDSIPQGLLEGNQTVAQDPWFDTALTAARAEAKSPTQDLLLQRSLVPADIPAEPGKRQTLRILVLGCAEKFGEATPLSKKPAKPHSLVCLRQILDALPNRDEYDIEIVGNDIFYQETIYEYDENGNFVGTKEAFRFDASGNCLNPPEGVKLVKLNADKPEHNLTGPPETFGPEGQFDIVINSRMAVQYQNDPETIHNLLANSMQYLKEGGILLYDTETADHIEIFRGPTADAPQPVTATAQPAGVTIPYIDVWELDRKLERVAANLPHVMTQQEEVMLRKAYLLALRHADLYRPVYEKMTLSYYLAMCAESPLEIAAFVLFDVPDAAVRREFDAESADDIIRISHNMRTPKRNYPEIYSTRRMLVSLPTSAAERFDLEAANIDFERADPLFKNGLYRVYLVDFEGSHVFAIFKVRVPAAGIPQEWSLLGAFAVDISAPDMLEFARRQMIRREILDWYGHAANPLNMPHVDRTARYAAIYARELGLSEEQVNQVEIAALLHDISREGQNILEQEEIDGCFNYYRYDTEFYGGERPYMPGREETPDEIRKPDDFIAELAVRLQEGGLIALDTHAPQDEVKALAEEIFQRNMSIELAHEEMSAKMVETVYAQQLKALGIEVTNEMLAGIRYHHHPDRLPEGSLGRAFAEILCAADMTEKGNNTICAKKFYNRQREELAILFKYLDEYLNNGVLSRAIHGLVERLIIDEQDPRLVSVMMEGRADVEEEPGIGLPDYDLEYIAQRIAGRATVPTTTSDETPTVASSADRRADKKVGDDVKTAAAAAAAAAVDGRPVEAGLWPEDRIRYFQAICSEFNLGWTKDGKGKTVFVPSAGTDVTTPFLVTDPETVIMAEAKSLISPRTTDYTQEDELKSMYQHKLPNPLEKIKVPEELAADYQELGYIRWRTFQEDFDDELIKPLVSELLILGAENIKIDFPPSEEKNRNYIKITFDWNYAGRSSKPRTIYYLYNTRSQNESEYPQEVVDLVKARGIDAVIQKAVQTYGELHTKNDVTGKLLPPLVLENMNAGSLVIGESFPEILPLRIISDEDPRMPPIRSIEDMLIEKFLRDEDLDSNHVFGLATTRRGIWGYAPHVQILTVELAKTEAEAPITKTEEPAPAETKQPMKDTTDRFAAMADADGTVLFGSGPISTEQAIERARQLQKILMPRLMRSLATLRNSYWLGIKFAQKVRILLNWRWPQTQEQIKKRRDIYVADSVRIEGRVSIEPGSVIMGDTVLNDGCYIGRGSYIKDSNIGKNARISGSVVKDANIEDSLDGERVEIKDCSYVTGHPAYRTIIHPGVKMTRAKVHRAILHRGVVLEPFSFVMQFDSLPPQKYVEIGEGTVISQHAEVSEDARVGKNCRIGAFSVIGGATIGNNVQFGEFVVTAFTDSIKDRKVEVIVEDGAVVGDWVVLLGILNKDGTTGPAVTKRQQIPSFSLVRPYDTQRPIITESESEQNMLRAHIEKYKQDFKESDREVIEANRFNLDINPHRYPSLAKQPELLKRLEQGGITVVDPLHAYVDPHIRTAFLKPGSVIYPFVSIGGKKTCLGNDNIIRPFSRLIDVKTSEDVETEFSQIIPSQKSASRLGGGSKIKGCSLEGTLISSECRIKGAHMVDSQTGSWSYMHGNARIKDAKFAKLTYVNSGPIVEKAVIYPNAYLWHTGIIKGAAIGEFARIGAGFFIEQGTKYGPGVAQGALVMVEPGVKVGTGGFLGALSRVTENVRPSALYFEIDIDPAKGQQKEGWKSAQRPNWVMETRVNLAKQKAQEERKVFDEVLEKAGQLGIEIANAEDIRQKLPAFNGICLRRDEDGFITIENKPRPSKIMRLLDVLEREQIARFINRIEIIDGISPLSPPSINWSEGTLRIGSVFLNSDSPTLCLDDVINWSARHWRLVYNVFQHYSRLGQVTKIEVLPGGAYSQPLLVTTDKGRYVLGMGSLRDTRETLQWEYEWVKYLRKRGFPTPDIIETDRRDFCVEIRDGRQRGRLYLIYEYIEGEHQDGTMPDDRLQEAARTMALMHRLQLADKFRPIGGKDVARERLEFPNLDNIEDTRRTYNEAIELVKELGRDENDKESLSPEELVVRTILLDEGNKQLLNEQFDKLAANLPPKKYTALQGENNKTNMIIHGDYYRGNILYDENGRAWTFDWDWARREPRGLDVANFTVCHSAMEDTSYFNVDEVRRFVRHYQAACVEMLYDRDGRLLPDLPPLPLTAEEIAAIKEIWRAKLLEDVFIWIKRLQEGNVPEDGPAKLTTKYEFLRQLDELEWDAFVKELSPPAAEPPAQVAEEALKKPLMPAVTPELERSESRDDQLAEIDRQIQEVKDALNKANLKARRARQRLWEAKGITEPNVINADPDVQKADAEVKSIQDRLDGLNQRRIKLLSWSGEGGGAIPRIIENEEEVKEVPPDMQKNAYESFFRALGIELDKVGGRRPLDNEFSKVDIQLTDRLYPLLESIFLEELDFTVRLSRAPENQYFLLFSNGKPLALVLDSIEGVFAISADPLWFQEQTRDTKSLTDEIEKGIAKNVERLVEPVQWVYCRELGKKIAYFAGVFSQDLGSELMGGYMKYMVEKDDRVLDMGTGCGRHALAVAIVEAKKVVALDNNPLACANAEFNSRLFGLQDVIDVRQSDLFSALSEDEKFDIVSFFVPGPEFNQEFEKRGRGQPMREPTLLEEASIDLDGETNEGFFRDVATYLSERGRVFVLASIPEGYVPRLAQKYGLKEKYFGRQKSPVRMRSYPTFGIYTLVAEGAEAIDDLPEARPGKIEVAPVLQETL